MDCKSSKFKIMHSFKRFLKNISVEPIIFCNFLAIAFFRVAENAGIYRVICIQNYLDQYKNLNCEDLKSNPEVEDMVQKDAANISMILSLAYLIPAIFSDIFLGAWADKHGRKINILLGLTGLIIASFPYSIVLTYPRTSLTILILANVVAGLTGYIAIVMISAMAYLTDIVHDKNTLTFRMAQVYVCNAAAAAVGSFAVGSLVQSAPLPYVIVVTEFILFLGFLYTLIRIKHVPPLILRKMVAEEVANENSTMKTSLTPKNIVDLDEEIVEKPPTSCREDLFKTVKYVVGLYKEVGHTFARPRRGRRRCYLYLMSLVFFLFLISELGLLHGNIMGLYVFHRPFYWSPADLGFWKGAQATLMLLGNLLGSWIMKRLFSFKDTTVLMVSLGSAVVHLTMMAVARTTWLMYAAVVCGMWANLALPTIKSFVAQLVDADEVGKAFTANGVCADLAFVASALLFNNIYSATVEFYAGSVFIFAALLLLICFFVILWIHVDSARTEPDIINEVLRTNSALSSTTKF